MCMMDNADDVKSRRLKLGDIKSVMKVSIGVCWAKKA